MVDLVWNHVFIPELINAVEIGVEISRWRNELGFMNVETKSAWSEDQYRCIFSESTCLDIVSSSKPRIDCLHTSFKWNKHCKISQNTIFDFVFCRNWNTTYICNVFGDAIANWCNNCQIRSDEYLQNTQLLLRSEFQIPSWMFSVGNFRHHRPMNT